MKMSQMRGVTGGVVLGMVAIGGACLCAGCSTNPTTGRSQLVAMSRAQEVALGAQAAPELTQEFGGQVQNAALRGYITEIGEKLKAHTEVDGPQRAWEFILLDSDVINAFALPGEKVFMSRGLADKLDNEAQLAGVLGHEIGHVMARHSNERISQSTLIGLLAQGAGVVAGAAVKDPTLGQVLPAIATQGGQLVVLKFSREQESEADTLGMRYMTRAGYNPRGQLQVMQVLKREAGSGGGPEFLATHPLPETRIREIQEKLNGEYAYTQNQPDQYGFYAERYEQRYLSLARQLPIKKQQAPKADAGSINETARERLLAGIVLEDPTTWCAFCRAAAHDAGGHIAP